MSIKLPTKSLYIHIPFCDHICFYCDFAKVFYNKEMVNQYLKELEKEINPLKDTFKTIYIGGGTPSSLSIEQLTSLFEMIKQLKKEKEIEYTIEANVENLTKEKLQLFKKYGINRLSIGVQSFQDEILKAIGRNHTSKQAIDTIHLASQYIKNISIDMMYGLPKQTIDKLKLDLKIIQSLPIKHLSYYSLILEEGTVLYNQKYVPINEEIDSKMGKMIEENLKQKGLKRYEISNYALDGYQSKHNLAYWKYENYYGVGVGASGKIDNLYYSHSKALMKYLRGEDIINKEYLSEKDTRFNHLMMSMRLIEGLDLNEYERRYEDKDDYFEKIKKQMLEKEYLIEEDHHLKCNGTIDILNSILVEFLED